MPERTFDASVAIQRQLTNYVIKMAKQHNLDAEASARLMIYSCGELLFVHSNPGKAHTIPEAFDSIIEIAEDAKKLAADFNLQKN